MRRDYSARAAMAHQARKTALLQHERRLGIPPRPDGMPEEVYRKMHYRQSTVVVNGQEFDLQSVSYRWYIEQNDEYGMTGGKRDTAGYMDTILRNVVTSPAAIAVEGLDYFDKRGDFDTPMKLMGAIDKFFRDGKNRWAQPRPEDDSQSSAPRLLDTGDRPESDNNAGYPGL